MNNTNENNETSTRIHIIVSGNVQGVFFRSYVKSCAHNFSIVGFVKNLSDGTVEIVAEGMKDKLLKFEHCVKKGSDNSHVDQCETKWENLTNEFGTFSIK